MSTLKVRTIRALFRVFRVPVLLHFSSLRTDPYQTVQFNEQIDELLIQWVQNDTKITPQVVKRCVSIILINCPKIGAPSFSVLVTLLRCIANCTAYPIQPFMWPVPSEARVQVSKV